MLYWTGKTTILFRVLTRAGRFMKGSEVLRSAFKEVAARLDRVAGAKAEAEPASIAKVRAANFIIVVWSIKSPRFEILNGRSCAHRRATWYCVDLHVFPVHDVCAN